MKDLLNEIKMINLQMQIEFTSEIWLKYIDIMRLKQWLVYTSGNSKTGKAVEIEKLCGNTTCFDMYKCYFL